MQRSSKKLTPERHQYVGTGQIDHIQSKGSLGLHQQSLKSSGPYHYLQWSKAQTPEKVQNEESHLKQLLQQNDPELLGLLSQQTSTFEQRRSSRERAFERASANQAQQENINPAHSMQGFNQQFGVLESNGPNHPLGSAQVTNHQLSLLHYSEDQKMQTGQPFGQLNHLVVSNGPASNAPVPKLMNLQEYGGNHNQHLQGQPLADLKVHPELEINHTFRNQDST